MKSIILLLMYYELGRELDEFDVASIDPTKDEMPIGEPFFILEGRSKDPIAYKATNEHCLSYLEHVSLYYDTLDINGGYISEEGNTVWNLLNEELNEVEIKFTPGKKEGEYGMVVIQI